MLSHRFKVRRCNQFRSAFTQQPDIDYYVDHFSAVAAESAFGMGTLRAITCKLKVHVANIQLAGKQLSTFPGADFFGRCEDWSEALGNTVYGYLIRIPPQPFTYNSVGDIDCDYFQGNLPDAHDKDHKWVARWQNRRLSLAKIEHESRC